MLSWVAPIIVFGVVVFVHELGHFLAAKWVGVYAPRFSIGFGPALWRKRWGETEYVLAALPLGGYVRMASRLDEESAFLEGGSELRTHVPETGGNAAGTIVPDSDPEPRPADWDPEALVPFGPKPVPEHRWFESKSLPQRLLIMIAGVTMNVLLALVIMIGLFASLGRAVTNTRVLGGVAVLPGTASLRNVLAAGDTIISVNGEAITNWESVTRAVGTAKGDVLTIVTHRDTVTIPHGGDGQPRREYIAQALQPMIPAVLDTVMPGGAAARAGVAKGDSVIAAGGDSIRSWSHLVASIEGSPGEPLELLVARGDTALAIEVVPQADTVTLPGTSSSRVVGRIGVGPRDIRTRIATSPAQAIGAGWNATWGMVGLVIDAVHQLVTARASVKELGGPIAIAEASVTAAQRGFQGLLELLAFISVNLAVMNLLPIPILDGGQIVMNIVESARGRAFSLRTREYILRVGLVAIGLLFVLVMFNDIKRTVERLIN